MFKLIVMMTVLVAVSCVPALDMRHGEPPKGMIPPGHPMQYQQFVPPNHHLYRRAAPNPADSNAEKAANEEPADIAAGAEGEEGLEKAETFWKYGYGYHYPRYYVHHYGYPNYYYAPYHYYW